MKKLYKFSILTLTALIISGGVSNLHAQSDDVASIIKAGTGDATKLAQAYLSPAFKGFGFGMNSGWYHSAKAKKLGKFDLKILGTAAVIPTKDQSFNLSDLGLSNNVRFTPNSMSPTLLGKDNVPLPVLTIVQDNGDSNLNNDTYITDFTMPDGTGFNYAPSPQIELTVGLIKNTDVTVRYSPKINIEGSGSIQTLGFGVKHEITKYLFPGKIDKIIPFDIALAFGYNQLKAEYKLDVNDQLNDENPGVDQNQRFTTSFSGYTIDAVLSKKLSIFTPFVSVGYNTAKSELNALGVYSFTDPTSSTGFTSVTDPIKINQKDIAGLRANVGFSLHLLIFRIYGAYSVGEYQAVTAGIGFGIGK